MTFITAPLRRHGVFHVLVAAGLAVLAGCSPKAAPEGFNDPFEEQNRRIHDFNRAVDTNVIKPASGGYSSILPAPVKSGIGNVAHNLDAPGDIANGILQGRPFHVAENTLRFLVNTTVGVGGLFDPASALGINGKRTDFGETLHVWGAGEGRYMELPLVGPTTERDMFGTIIDIGLNPLRYALPTKEANIATFAKFGSRLGDRSRYSNTIDSVLYDSADSYAQARLLYLQNRRFELGQTGSAGSDDDFIDPYEDPYGQ
jgi:phospholipid-binding lipoprotein MlaA